MELVFTLPILGLLLLGLLEFSLVFFARADVAEACRAGARKATLHGTTLQDVETEVRRVLAPGLQAGLQVDANLDVDSGDVVSVSVSTPPSRAPIAAAAAFVEPHAPRARVRSGPSA